jgi:hypothetical protein
VALKVLPAEETGIIVVVNWFEQLRQQFQEGR